MPFGLIFSITLIFAGAIGNLIDSAFYGLIFSHSSYHTLATLFPEGGGYDTFLHGKVVDMFYFPLIRGYYPDWFPFWGGNDFIFFRPVFNLADSSITTGVLILILFQRKYFTRPQEKAEENQEDDTETTEEQQTEDTADVVETDDEGVIKIKEVEDQDTKLNKEK
jgi:signal peptidase II